MSIGKNPGSRHETHEKPDLNEKQIQKTAKVSKPIVEANIEANIKSLARKEKASRRSEVMSTTDLDTELEAVFNNSEKTQVVPQGLQEAQNTASKITGGGFLRGVSSAEKTCDVVTKDTKKHFGHYYAAGLFAMEGA